MVVSVNSQNNLKDFDNLLGRTIIELNKEAKRKPVSFKELAGNKLEPYVRDLMEALATGTPFQGSIELISGQRFPDIIAKKYFGVEVKTTTGNHWKTTGNSVLEGTRVDGIERIFMLFGKLGAPIEFRSRLYEECLSEVVVTHSPRYQIDMELAAGQTIFDKMKISYDELRETDSIRTIKNYYKEIAVRRGNDVWWIDNDKNSDFIIQLWSSLPQTKRDEIVAQSMVFFPEIFSNVARTKYNRLATWLTTGLNIICPNIRDNFSASGQLDIRTNDVVYRQMPQVLGRLQIHIGAIKNILKSTDANTLSDFWGIKTTDKTKLTDWRTLIIGNAKTLPQVKNINVDKLINDITA